MIAIERYAVPGTSSFDHGLVSSVLQLSWNHCWKWPRPVEVSGLQFELVELVISCVTLPAERAGRVRSEIQTALSQTWETAAYDYNIEIQEQMSSIFGSERWFYRFSERFGRQKSV